MTTPSQKPTWLDRYTMIGDTIPMSRTAGGGGGSNRVFVDFGDTPSYPVNTRFHAFQEPATSGAQNRPHWALAEALAWLYERELAQPYVQAGTTVGPTAGIPIASSIVYLGELGYTTSDIPKVADLLDGNWDELHDEAVPPNHIIGSDYQVLDPLNTVWVSCYPGGGLPADTASAPISGVGSPDNYSITTTSALTGSATGVSVMNYDKWLREIRDAGSPEDAFATIIDWTSNQSFKVHRDVTSGGLDWTASDTLFVSHFAYAPSIVAAPTLPSGQAYNFAVGIHSTLGRLEKNAITSLKVRTAEEVPFDVEKFILGGLDAAYDQLGFGVQGGGRVVTVDSGPIFLDVSGDGEIGLEAGSSSASGSIGLLAYNRTVNTNSGIIACQFMSAKADTTWNSPESCTAGTNDQIVLNGGGNFEDAGGNSDIILDVDMIYVQDSSGDPLDIGGKAPNGLYILDTIVNSTTATVKFLDGSAPGAVMTGASTATWLRPLSAMLSGAVGGKLSNVLAAWGSSSLSSALELHGVVNLASSQLGALRRSYVGNVDAANPIVVEEIYESAYTSGAYTPSRVLSSVGTVSATGVEEIVEMPSPSGIQFGYNYLVAASPETLQFRDEIDIDADTWFRTLSPFGYVSGGLSNAIDTVHYEAAYQLGDWDGQANDDSFAFRAYPYDGHKYAYGLVGDFSGSPSATALVIKESPTGPTAPLGTNANTVNHRCENNVNTNYGYSDWRSLVKQVDSSSAVGGGSWTRDVTQNTKHYWRHPGAATAYIVHPITIPHNCRLDAVTCYLDHGATAMGAQTMSIYVSRWDLSSTGSSYTNLDSDSAVDPSGGIEGFTLNSGSLPYYPADLEDNVFLVRVVTGLAATRQFYYGCQVKFSYVDIHPD